MSKIYTRKGDSGTTVLVGGQRVLKYHVRLEAYGTIDELNAHVGMLSSLLSSDSQVLILRQVQNCLFDLGSYLATAEDDSPTLNLNNTHVELLESEIDRLDSFLEPLRHFILPSGSVLIAQSHICRTVCRRAERNVVNLSQQSKIELLAINFLNRLSDYFFVVARFLAKENEIEEIKWTRSCE